MATANTSETNKFESQLIQIKSDIETHFHQLIDCLKERENELLRKLEEINDNYKKEKLKQNESLIELNRALKANQENILSTGNLKGTQSIFIEAIKEKQEEIQNEFSLKRILFEFDSTLLEKIKLFANITVFNSTDSCLPVVKYKDKVRPVMCIGDVAGNSVGQFNNPWGVEVDKQTGNIYVADHSNSRVKIYDENFNYLSNFGKIVSALCIAISKEKVFVSQDGLGSFSVFDMKGTLLKQIGTTGSGNGQFKNPRAVAINESNDDIYVCDSTNNRIQIFSKDYSYKSQFGKTIFNYPFDIQLTKDNIYVLSFQNPFLFIFTYNYQYLQNIISPSISKHLNCPYTFKIDGAGNFIFSDVGNNSIYIFDHEFTLLHQITEGISKPRGVTIDSNGRLVVAGYNHRLLIF